MASINGIHVGFECSNLIKELKEDIKEFGGNTIVAVWRKDFKGATIYTNYDFIVPDQPLISSELKPGESIGRMTMTALLAALEEQNKIF